MKTLPAERIVFTEEMRKTHTILVPNMAPIHFPLLKAVLSSSGYRVALLENQSPRVIEQGLRYVHNDTCYPALLVIGQILDALQSGAYDLAHTAVMISQTGGGCRASNYIHLLRKALEKAGFADIPVVSLNMSGLEQNPGFTLTLPMLQRMLYSVVYGDALMLLSNQVRPYEVQKGETTACLTRWVAELQTELSQPDCCHLPRLRQHLQDIAADFASIPIVSTPKTKVGVVGEIYVKYSPLGNNHLEEFLAGEDCEVMLPGILGFVMFNVDTRLEDGRLYGGKGISTPICSMVLQYMTRLETELLDAIGAHPQFTRPGSFAHSKSLVQGIIGHGVKMGEGWLLTAEMMDLIELGYPNIVCAQPFGCLPNHICGKGMIRSIQAECPEANIVPIDYDPSATRVNQENRIKLMLAIGKEKRLERLTLHPVAAPLPAKRVRIA